MRQNTRASGRRALVVRFMVLGASVPFLALIGMCTGQVVRDLSGPDTIPADTTSSIVIDADGEPIRQSRP